MKRTTWNPWTRSLRTVALGGLCLVTALSGFAAEDGTTPEAAGEAFVVKPFNPACVLSVKDVGASGTCRKASSQPWLGRLYPITEDLFVAGTGEVGIGTTQPGSQLSVSGVIHSTSGGFRFPDGNLQTTVRITGDTGPQGPIGDPGDPGNPGDPGIPGVVPLNGLSGSFLTLTATGGASVSAFNNTLTVNAPSVACTYSTKTYTTGQICYTFGDEIPCAVGFRQLKLVCQAGGSWQVISSSACNNPSLLPVCGF